MARYRKKPVVIDAWQWTGKVNDLPEDITAKAMFRIEGDSIFIVTLEGRMQASKGDWIIRGVKGEFYPIKPEIFEETYELEYNYIGPE